jgi:SnoaL-like domain
MQSDDRQEPALAAPPEPASATTLDIAQHLIATAQATYAQDVEWSAPRRELIVRGRDAVVRLLLQEAAAMEHAQFTLLRRSVAENQVIDEYTIRFVYAGSGIARLDRQGGETVELERLRILALDNGLIVKETCIEQWTLLPG